MAGIGLRLSDELVFRNEYTAFLISLWILKKRKHVNKSRDLRDSQRGERQYTVYK